MITPDPPPAIRPRGSDWNSFMNTDTTAGWSFLISFTRSCSAALTGSAAAATATRARNRGEAIRRCLRMGMFQSLSASGVAALLHHPGVAQGHLVAEVRAGRVGLGRDLQLVYVLHAQVQVHWLLALLYHALVQDLHAVVDRQSDLVR